jgi:polyphosphate kinase
MKPANPNDHATKAQALAELTDSFDESLELEFDDDTIGGMLAGLDNPSDVKTAERQSYFKELLRLQRELVRLQDWVVHTQRRVVVVFEGRDSAGKGGVIKRITQRLNPRVCRVAALPAPSERERTQWYFQRYVAHLPAAGEIVLFDRSWYNRAGVEQVGHYAHQVLVLDHGRGAEPALSDAHP